MLLDAEIEVVVSAVVFIQDTRIDRQGRNPLVLVPSQPVITPTLGIVLYAYKSALVAVFRMDFISVKLCVYTIFCECCMVV